MKKAINQSVLSFLLNGVSVLALIFMAVSIAQYSDVNKKLDQANEERFLLTYNANRFMNGSAYLTNEVRAFASTGDQEHYDNYWNEVNTLKNRDKGVEAMEKIGITKEEQSMIQEMSSLSNNLVPLEEEAMKQVQAGQREEALSYVYGEEYKAVITEINGLKEEFLTTLDGRAAARVEQLGQRADMIKTGMMAAMVIVAVMQISSMIITRIRILRPVIAVRDQMGEISRGNLSAEFSLRPDTSEIGTLVQSIHETKQELKRYISDINEKLAQMAEGKMDLTIGSDYRGEFRPIQEAMKQILNGLNGALSRITVTAEQVSEESRHMNAGAQTLSNGATQQAAAVEELSASIQELSKQVDSTSEDASDARQSSEDTAMQLQLCSEKMQELTTAMEDISKSSQQIGGIIKTIEDISFQTNILALNAAVEAARAGTAGKGFAVVAEEVQTLANKSAVSAQNITELIEASMHLVEKGTALSADTMEALMGGVAGSQKSTELISRIASSAMQQADSLKQLTQGMDLIAEVVQTNALTAEESANSAEGLYGQAEELKVSVQKFQLR